MVKGSLQDELDLFFKTINPEGGWKRVVSKSAFCKARKKLKYLAFIELNQLITRFFYIHFSNKTWHGFNLLAIDGSTLGLPFSEENMDYFGGDASKKKKSVQARVSQLFDTLNKITIHALIAPVKTGEREMASEHLLYIRPTDLVLLDRGYPAFWLFKLILTNGGQFCARISPKTWKKVGQFADSKAKDGILEIKADYLARKHCQELGLDYEPITLRLIRIGPDDQILVTSLMDNDVYPYEIVNDLYHYRWPVETDYNTLKNRIVVESWTGLSITSIYQDFHAKVLSKNLAAVLIHSVQEELDQQQDSRKYKYQVNWTQAISKLKWFDCGSI